MTRLVPFLRRFARDTGGATLVEFGVVMAVFLFVIFGIIDYGRLGYSTVMAEKATETAVRMAVVRPSVCPDLPEVNQRGLVGALSVDLPNGTPCTARAGLCRPARTVSCTDPNHPTAQAVFAQVQPLLPTGAQADNLRFSYSFDADLNRVGAPYSPVVTVDIDGLAFDFISPLGALAAAAGADGQSDLGASFTFSSMSASLPAEDLR